ncbi:MAG: amino acid permease [Bacteroidetes bacterium]|nr:amino acid permease [Bacteroidota bacterium]
MEENSTGKLERKLGLFPLTNIVIANMIGAGIFTTSGLLMSDLGNPVLMIVLWIAGGVIALCGALCYGELGAAIPQAGGEYAFLSRLYHPLLGFLSGWVSFIVGFSAPIAASSIGFSEYLARAFPHVLDWGAALGLTSPALSKNILSILVIALLTFVHLRGIDFGTLIQNYLTVLKVGLIVALILVGLTFGNGDFNHFTLGTSFSFDFGGWKTIGLSLLWIMFAYSGWNASTYIGSEVKHPEATIPRSLVLGTGIVSLLYLSLNAVYVYAIDPDTMKGVISIGGLAMGNLVGRSMETLFSLMIALALLSSLSAFIILGPRVYYSMAKDGYFFRFVSEISPKFRVPSKAIVLQGTIAAVIVLSGTMDQILTYMGFSLGIFPLLAVFGIFRLRRSKKHHRVLPGYPVVPLFYLFFGIAMLLLSFLERPVESSISILTVVVGIPAYYFFKSRYSKSATALSS